MLRSMKSQRVGHNLATEQLQMQSCTKLGCRGLNDKETNHSYSAEQMALECSDIQNNPV